MIALDTTFQSTLRKRPDHPALISRSCGCAHSFAELDQAVTQATLALARYPAGPVALAIASRARLVVLVLAAWRAERAVVLLDPGQTSDELAAWAPRLGARLLVHETSANDARLMVTGAAGTPSSDGIWSILEPQTTLPPGTALVKVTSGSTGEPTGVALDAAALLAGIDQISRGMGIDEGDRIVVPLPLSHSYGFDSGVMSLLALGTPLILESSLYPSALFAGLAKEAGSVLLLVPPLVRSFASLEWPRQHSVRLVISAGGPLEPSFAEAFQRASGVHVRQFYGSTETGGICFEADPMNPAAAGTVGQPLPGVQVELDADGRVVVSSPANATALVCAGVVQAITGPIATGDTGEWTDTGRLRLTGRVAGLLNVAGRRIQLTGLESKLARLPGVREVAAVALPESLRGDRIVVFVVTDGSRLEPRSLPRGVRPREVHYLESLPYTERGKLDRRRLLALAQGDAR